jgi:hypothetical protein
MPLTIQRERTTLPPHLSQTRAYIKSIYVTGQQHQGNADPFNPTTGLAEPSNPAQVSAALAKTAPPCGAPRPEEDTQE